MDSLKVQYEDMVRNLKKPGRDIAATITANQADMMHMAIGIAGEAGELLDAVKRHVIYNKLMDYGNLIEEMGDLEFFLEGLRQQIDVTREHVLQMNMNKLAKRYKEKQYSDAAAQMRADKQ